MTVQEISPKSYTVAVCLSAIFGLLGIQHFYLGRWLLGIADVSLSVGAAVCLFSGDPSLLFLGVGLLVADFIHTLITTIMLMIGAFKDGQGRIVAYPGQRFD